MRAGADRLEEDTKKIKSQMEKIALAQASGGAEVKVPKAKRGFESPGIAQARKAAQGREGHRIKEERVDQAILEGRSGLSPAEIKAREERLARGQQVENESIDRANIIAGAMQRSVDAQHRADIVTDAMAEAKRQAEEFAEAGQTGDALQSAFEAHERGERPAAADEEEGEQKIPA